MNDNVNNMDKIERNAKTAFKQQTESLDSETLHRLRMAREMALSKKSCPIWLPAFNLKWITSAGAGLALAGVLTFLVMPNLMPSSYLDEFEMLTVEGDMDLVAQLEFYQWLDDSSLSE